MLKFVLILAFSSVSLANDVRWFLDLTIDKIRTEIESNKMERVGIPDFVQHFSTEIFGIRIPINVRAENGFMKNLTTIRTTGPAPMSEKGTTMMINAGLGLDELQVDYEFCYIEFMGIPSLAKASTTCKSNNFDISVDISPSGKDNCTATLNSVRISKLEDCLVTLEPPSVLNWIRSKIFTYYFNHFKTDFGKIYDAHLKSLVEPFVKENDLCTYL